MLRCTTSDAIPSLVFAIGGLTLLIPFVLIRARHIYVGGMSWPFIADMTRDFPVSIVFAISLNVLALLVSVMWLLNARRHQRFVERSILDELAETRFLRLSRVCNALGAIGALTLPIYGFLRVATMLHRVVGAIFLTLEAAACIINSYLNYQICLARREELETGVFVTIKYAPRSVAIEKLTALKRAKRAFLVELASSALFVMCLVVYLPLLYQVVPARRLSVSECLDRDLGEHYCRDTVRLNETDTSLWSYEADFAGYQVRAFAQLGCLLTLLTYSLSFIVGNDDDEDALQERDKLYHSALSRTSPLLGSPRRVDDVAATTEPRGRRRSRSRPGSPGKRSSQGQGQGQGRVRSPSGSPPERSPFQSPRGPHPPGPKSYISV